MATTVECKKPVWAMNLYPNPPLTDYQRGVALEDELLSEFEVHQLACEQNPDDPESWMKWGVTMRSLASIFPLKNQDITMFYLRGAKCKLEKALLIKEDYYEAMYELGMVHYSMILWDKSVDMYGRALKEQCRMAVNFFKEVKDKAPDVYIEDMLEQVRQQVSSELEDLKVWELSTKEDYDDTDDELHDVVGTCSSFQWKMIKEVLDLVFEKLALDPDDVDSKIEFVKALRGLPIGDPNGNGEVHEESKQLYSQEVLN